jgi:hypothetical protein
VESPQVGQNLNDHVACYMDKITLNETARPYLSRVPEVEFEAALQEYEKTGGGVLGEFQEGPQAILVSSRAKASGEGTWPDSRVIFDFTCPTAFEDDQPLEACFWGELDRARSKGSLRLNATAYKNGETDDTKLSILDWNMFGDESDMDVLIEGKRNYKTQDELR